MRLALAQLRVKSSGVAGNRQRAAADGADLRFPAMADRRDGAGY